MGIPAQLCAGGGAGGVCGGDGTVRGRRPGLHPGRDLLVPLVVITAIVAGFAVARVLLWPDSLPLRFALEVSYRIILLTAAIALLRARKGRWELGHGCWRVVCWCSI